MKYQVVIHEASLSDTAEDYEGEEDPTVLWGEFVRQVASGRIDQFENSVEFLPE